MDFQSLKYEIYSVLFSLGTGNTLMMVCLVLSLGLFFSLAGNRKDRIKAVVVVLSTALMAFLGARVLHVLLENRALLSTPELIFARFDGMTFNGSLLFGVVTFYLMLFVFDRETRARYWDRASLVTALSYGFLRISCFANGCCWGKVSAVPWRVTYTNSLVMPWIGIPVHPVQLYDSLLSFVIFGILLVCFKYKLFTGKRFLVFLFLYSLVRFGTEFLRGDQVRGENIWLTLSTSQVLSIFIWIGLGSLFLIKRPEVFSTISRLRRISALTALSICTLFLSGCLPQKPDVSLFKSVQENQTFEIYQSKKAFNKKRNVLFMAADDNIQQGFSSQLKALYQTDQAPRIEDIVFWEYIKRMTQIYQTVVRVTPSKVGYESLQQGLLYMESLGEPYDLILLTHGMPNHLSTGKGYFFSYRELANLKGMLPGLDTVLLQSCFGTTLAQDFKNAGAKNVLSFSGLNRNFFFYGIFLKYYSETESAQAAYSLAKNNFGFHMGLAPYSYVIPMMLAVENGRRQSFKLNPLTYSEFILQMDFPTLD